MFKALFVKKIGKRSTKEYKENSDHIINKCLKFIYGK